MTVSTENTNGAATLQAARTFGTIAILLVIFLSGVGGLGDGFKLLGRDILESFFAATSNPLIALMVGLLATTLAQSSSVTTSMVVGLVAAPENPLPLANAVPMIMGANIGTTVTNTFVAMAHIGRKDEFRRAFSVATCHDFFNFLAVAILLPLEMATGLLQRTAESITAVIGPSGGVSYSSPIKGLLNTVIAPVHSLAVAIFDSPIAQGFLLIVLSALMIFYALATLVRTLRTAMTGKAQEMIQGSLGKNAILAIGLGMVVTMAVQSSSITTSLLVPLGGAGVITTEQAFPVTLGANLGTTLTALLASLATSGENASAGVTIAVVHVLFNVAGTLIFFPIRAIRMIPVRAAERLAVIAAESRGWAIAYVLFLFYMVPALFAFLDRFL
jgi:sodium-dependent phosphate cotransporter